jgi:protein-disulfide isomerase
MEPQETPQKKAPVNLAAAIVTAGVMIAIALVIIAHPSKSTGTLPTTQQPPATPTSVSADIATVRESDLSHVRGNLSTAEVVIIEYSDSDCPFCVRFHPTLQQIIDDYKGRVAWVYRFFPLDMHPNAFNEAIALQCSSELGGAKGFNSYIDSIINVTVNPDPKSNEILSTIATQQGLDAAKFKACLADPATKTTINNGIQEAQSIGAQGTPFSIAVNIKTGKQAIIPGAYPIDEMKQTIDGLLK